MIKRYMFAMNKAEETSNKIYIDINRGKVYIPLLYRHILRDTLFGIYSNENNILSYKPSLKTLIMSLVTTIKYLYNAKQKKTVLCVQENTFNYYMKSQAIKLYKIDLVFDKEVNPILGLKIISYFIAIMKIFFNKKRRNIIFLLKNKENGRLATKVYFKYIQQLIHAILTKKTFPKLIYFSLGTPSYGRYIYSDFHELQHGVIHDLHPAICPIKQPKGLFILSRLFIKYNTKVSSIVLDEKIKGGINHGDKCLCFPSVLPENEMSIVNYVKNKYKDVDIFYHPRSTNYKISVFTNVKERIDAITSAYKIITSPSSVIIDAYNLGNTNIEIILTKFDSDEFNVFNSEDAALRLSEFYMVPILATQVVFLNK